MECAAVCILQNQLWKKYRNCRNSWKRRWHCLGKRIHWGKDLSSTVVTHLNYLGKPLTDLSQQKWPATAQAAQLWIVILLGWHNTLFGWGAVKRGATDSQMSGIHNCSDFKSPSMAHKTMEIESMFSNSSSLVSL